MMSEIINVRIDSRLIHGQVAALWSKALQINRIVVIDKDVIKDDLTKQLLKVATPTGIKLSIISPNKYVENMKINKYVGEKVMVILKGVEALVELSSLNYYFEEVNVGNISKKPDTIAITNQIYCTNEMLEDFRKLSSNTKFFVQLVPSDNKKSFIEIINNL